MAPKSIALTHVLWLLLGGFGIHKCYLGNPTMGITYILLGIFGGLTALVGVGLVLLAILGVMLIVDLFTIPEQVNDDYRRTRPQPYFGHY